MIYVKESLSFLIFYIIGGNACLLKVVRFLLIKCTVVWCIVLFLGGAIDWVLNSAISNDLLGRLTDSTCGEEVFFQTIFLNSPFKNQVVNDNLRYTDWSVHCPPKVLTVEDYDKIINSHKLFCRKIDSIVSKNLICKLLTVLG